MKIKNVVEKKYLIHVGANYLITKENWRTELGFLIDYDSDTNKIYFYAMS